MQLYSYLDMRHYVQFSTYGIISTFSSMSHLSKLSIFTIHLPAVLIGSCQTYLNIHSRFLGFNCYSTSESIKCVYGVPYSGTRCMCARVMQAWLHTLNNEIIYFIAMKTFYSSQLNETLPLICNKINKNGCGNYQIKILVLNIVAKNYIVIMYIFLNKKPK